LLTLSRNSSAADSLKFAPVIFDKRLASTSTTQENHAAARHCFSQEP
jgi:hypothetical protein